jgi:alkylated DNA repair protein alkB family protein 4
LEYDEKRGSNIAPHIDDVWLWGERIVGINILSDTVMTFYKDDQDCTIEIELPFKRRGIYIISGASRFEWKHGIKPENI